MTDMNDQDEMLLRVENLVKYFPITSRDFLNRRKKAVVHAVDDVSFVLRRGETLSLVGESGCGKSTIGRTILQLYPPTSGAVYLEGVDLAKLNRQELRQKRQKMQMVFQDPYASLNPRLTAGEIVADPLLVYNQRPNRSEIDDQVDYLLNLVGLNASLSNRYPHEFSAGQRERINVARALALQPELVICDDPISALDVSTQAQIVNLLEGLQQQFNLTYIFMAQDPTMVRHISDRVAVMYLGIIVEQGRSEEIYNHPLHPYTQALLASAPTDPMVEEKRQRTSLKGYYSSPINPPSGCRFRTRCPLAQDICARVVPEWRELSPGHFTACHFAR